MYINKWQMTTENTNGYNRTCRRTDADACSSAYERDRMEVLPGAHGRPSKQREPPRKSAEKNYVEWRRRSVRPAIRQHFLLYNARSPTHSASLSFIVSRGSRFLNKFLPTESNYLGSLLYQILNHIQKGRTRVRSRFTRCRGVARPEA